MQEGIAFSVCSGKCGWAVEGANRQVSIHASASQLADEALQLSPQDLLTAADLIHETERASQQDTASFPFRALSLTTILWQVKCQEPGRGGVWKRREVEG